MPIIVGDKMKTKKIKVGDVIEVKKDWIGNVNSTEVVVWERAKNLFEDGYYGKLLESEKGEYLSLSLVEALYLLKKKKIKIVKDGKKMNFKSFYNYCSEVDKRFRERYAVYQDLRDRGFLAKTGFKFGCDFRVYEKGVKLKHGPKTQKEHTKWIVFSVPEDYNCSFQELSRAVRLAHNIRARMLWAIVDNESDITYYEVLRMKP